MGWFFCYFNNNNVYYIVDYLKTKHNYYGTKNYISDWNRQRDYI